MKRSIVGALLPRSFPVLRGLAGTDIEAIYLARVHGTEQMAAADVAALAAQGIAVSYDAFGFGTIDAVDVVDDATFRAETLLASAAFAQAVADLPGDERAGMPDHLRRILATELAAGLGSIDVLDALAAVTDVRGVIVGEDISTVPRTLVRWARARGIPSLCLTHSAGPYNLLSAQFLVDDHYVYGEHTVPWLRTAGVRDDQIHLGTFYGHREHLDVSPHARDAFRAERGIGDDEIVVAYTLAFNAFTSSVEPRATWWLASLLTFARAVRHLRDAGLRFRTVVKHRFVDPGVAETVRQFAQHLDIELLYFDGAMSALLPAADILCGSASNATIEATFYDLAVLDLVNPWLWFIGPQYGRDDGVPYVDADDPDAIAAALGPLIADPVARARNVARSRAFAARIVSAPDRDDARIARDLLAILDARRATLQPSAPPVSAPLASIRAIPASATRVLDRTGSRDTAGLVRLLHGIDVDTDAARAHDVVLLGGALARSSAPAVELTASRAALEPGGRVIAEFPNARNLRYITALAAHEAQPGRLIARDGASVPYTATDAIALVEAAGLTVESLVYRIDPALAAIEASDGLSSIAAGDVTIDAATPADVEQLKATAFTLVARAPSV
jgi:hypothetical protein